MTYICIINFYMSIFLYSIYTRMVIINLLIVLLYVVAYTNEGFDEKVNLLLHRRQIRQSEPVDCPEFFMHLGIGMTVLVACVGVLLLLICFGIIKGLIGLLCSPKIGMFGMHVLIDLPRPMKHYHESELSGMEVIYDIGGWPIHPQTGQRGVRPISKSTEFCMNVVFFLTYPFIMLIGCCSFCCYKSYDEEEIDNEAYENVNTVVFSECPRNQVKECKDKSKLCRGSCVQQDVYKDEDSAEEADTKYVLEQMNDSREKLHQ